MNNQRRFPFRQGADGFLEFEREYFHALFTNSTLQLARINVSGHDNMQPHVIAMSVPSRARQSLKNIYRHTPDCFRRAMRVRRHMKLWNETGIVFVHVPKCAGTSISEAIYGRFTNHVHAADVRRWGGTQAQTLPSFAVTRNPWDRLVSAYRFAVRGHGVGGNFVVKTWQPEQYQTGAFATFGSFVEEWLIDRNPNKLDPIFQSQKLFICDGEGNILVDHVGKVENLSQTADFIDQRLGNSIRFPHHNRSGAQVCYRKFYCNRLANIVGDIYRDDVALFGYDF